MTDYWITRQNDKKTTLIIVAYTWKYQLFFINETLPENIIDPIAKGTKKAGPANPWRSVRIFLEDPILLPNVVIALLMVLLNHLRFPKSLFA